jgi:hypothetical protein
MKRAGLALVLVAVAAIVGSVLGCAGRTAQRPDAVRSDSRPLGATESSPSTQPFIGTSVNVARPATSAVEATVRRFAAEQNAKVPVTSVTVAGYGQDVHGVWWVQAWTESPSPHD